VSFPAYPSYRDGGVEWLSGLPESWELLPLKRTAALVTAKATERTFPVALENIEGKSGRLIETDADFSGVGTAFLAGDVLYGKLRPYLAKVYPAQRAGEAIGDFHVLRPKACSDAKFLTYLLLTDEATSILNGSTHGAKMPRVSWEALGGFPAPLPPLSEQTAIAAFLDRETAKIDALVEEQRRLIELLKEKRQAVISHAVTKGLGPTVPMKDSGVEWLGQVPVHWEVTAIKRLCETITDGAHISPETEGGVYCFVSTRDVSDEGIDFDGCLRTTPDSFDYLVRTGCAPQYGDVLFSKDGTIGRTTVVGDAPEFVVASSLIIIRPNADVLDSEFLDLLCKAVAVQQQVSSFVKGAGLPRLSIQNLLRVIGVFPPMEEQRAIVATIAPQIEALASLSVAVEAGIALLFERRAALISAAVTGKIDVRGTMLQQAEAA